VVALDARKIEDEVLGLISAYVRLDLSPELEERAVELSELGGDARNRDWDRCSARRRSAPELVHERGEVAAGVVPDNHFPGTELLAELPGEVVVERMH
jgi:hypothetical protein